MRTLLIGAMATTLIGCSCLIPPQAGLRECTSTSCFGSMADAPLFEPKAARPNVAAAKAKSTKVAKTTTTPKPPAPTVVAKMAKSPQPSSGERDHRADAVEKNTHTPSEAMSDASATAQPTEISDPVLKQAKATIATKIENLASVEFADAKRAIRKNTFGKPVDTICGHVKIKNASGEDTGARPFLYLVKDNEAYVVDGNSESAAAIAYRNICH